MISVDHLDMIRRCADNIMRHRPNRLPPSIALARTALLSISNLVYVIEWRDELGNQRVNLGWLAEENNGAYVLTSALLPEIGTARLRVLGAVAIDKAQVTSVTEVIVRLPTLVSRPVGKGVTR